MELLHAKAKRYRNGKDRVLLFKTVGGGGGEMITCVSMGIFKLTVAI